MFRPLHLSKIALLTVILFEVTWMEENNASIAIGINTFGYPR